MPQPHNPYARSSATVSLSKVSVRGIKSAIDAHDSAAGVKTTKVALTAGDFAIIERELYGRVGEAQTLTIQSLAGSNVTISIWTTGVTSGNAALTGFNE